MLQTVNWRKLRFNKANAELLIDLYDVTEALAKEAMGVSVRNEKLKLRERFNKDLQEIFDDLKNYEPADI